MKSLLFAMNKTSQSGTIVDFGQVARECGCNVNLSGGNAVVAGPGYYNVLANITFSATADGVATFTLYKDGIAVNAVSLTVATGSAYNVTIPAVIRNCCCKESTITVEQSGDLTANVASIIVEKV